MSVVFASFCVWKFIDIPFQVVLNRLKQLSKRFLFSPLAIDVKLLICNKFLCDFDTDFALSPLTINFFQLLLQVFDLARLLFYELLVLLYKLSLLMIFSAHLLNLLCEHRW